MFKIILSFVFASQIIDGVDPGEICVPEYHLKGVYICSHSVNQNLNSLVCEVVGAKSCTAIPLKDDKKAIIHPSTQFTLDIDQDSFTKDLLHIVIKNGDSPSKPILESFSLKYFYPLDVQTRIDCTPQDSTIASESKYSCVAYISKENYVLSKSDNSDCIVSIPTAEAVSSPPYLYSKSYNVVVKDSNKKCRKECEVELSIPDTDENNSQIKKKIKHVTFCQEPLIYCDNHDIESRRIGCKIHVTYPIHHIKLESSVGHIALDLTKISSSELDSTQESDVSITYKLNDLKTDQHNFQIAFKLYQKEGETDDNLAHSKEISFQYYLNSKEKPYIQCEISSQQPEDFHSTKYTCNMLSTSQEISISVDPDKYTISPTTSTGTEEKKMYVHTNKQFILSQTDKVCNQHHELKLKFTDGGEVSTIVPHLTTCPEPRIKCHKHNTIESQITCDFEVEYPFTKMEIKTSKLDFSINPTEITSDQFNLNTNKKLENKVFTYTVSNLLDPNHQFDLKFSFTQSNHKKPHTVTYNFAYVLKANEIPHLSCELHASQPTSPFHAIKYSCSVYTTISSTTLLVKPVNDFDIVHDAIALETDRHLKYKTEIDVTVKRKTIVCGSVKEFEISFSDSQGTYSYIDTHITTCPEPKISCNSHDTVSRNIICSFQIPYEAAEILLTSGKSHVHLKDTTFPVKSNVDTPFNVEIKYTIDSYSEKDHKFSIQFRVMQPNDNQGYAFSQEFTYILTVEEQSHIACTPQDDKENVKFESNSYLCTIVTRRNKVELKTNDVKYVVNPDEVEGNDYKGLKRRQITVTLTANPVLCRKNKLVELSFEDESNDVQGGTKKHTYTINHETICPDPIIDCDEHDVVERNIKCRVQIGFPYVKVKLSATPENRVTLSKSEWLKNDIDSASESKILIKYTLLDWSASDHRINIEFKVMQGPNNHEAYSTTQGFSYILKETEKPHITCESKSSDTTTFSVIEYTCSVLTKVNSLNIQTNPDSYVIQEPKPKLVNADSVYKVAAHKYLIKPRDIVCDLVQIVKLYFTDGGIDYSTKVFHTTTCPEPTFVYDTHDRNTRTINLKTQAPYEFESGTIESDTSTMAVSTESVGSSSKVSVGDKQEATFVINYEPTDLTQNSITFSMIAKLTLKSGSLTKSKTQSYTVQLKDEELPHLKCGDQIPLSTDKFTISYYKCEILSRNPNVDLILETPNYVITERSGESFEFKKVYKWKDYKILIRDDAIKCGQEITLDIKFNDLNGVVNHQPKIATTCPAPKVSCSNHNQTSRTIICKVLAEFPYTKVQISKETGEVTITSPNSEISAGSNTWSSIHTIQYSLSSLKQTNFDFKFKVSVEQDQHKVETEYSMSYIIFDEEKPQITCVAEEMNTQSDVSTTKYLCYMVTQKQTDVQIKINDTNVELSQSLKTSTKFVDLYKWTDVEVVVRDKIILCHKPIYLTLSIKDADDDSKEYNTVVKHTTRCKEISGNCTFLNQQSQPYIVCSFKSEQKFKFISYTCTEMVDCTKQEDTAQVTRNDNEFIIEFEPRVSSELVEFNLTVTFQYSEKSPVSFNYEFEYSRNSVPVIHGAAKATDSFFGISVVLGVAVIIFIIFFRKKSNKKLDGGDV